MPLFCFGLGRFDEGRLHSNSQSVWCKRVQLGWLQSLTFSCPLPLFMIDAYALWNLCVISWKDISNTIADETAFPTESPATATAEKMAFDSRFECPGDLAVDKIWDFAVGRCPALDPKDELWQTVFGSEKSWKMIGNQFSSVLQFVSCQKNNWTTAKQL